MLAQRIRRWANIILALVRVFVWIKPESCIRNATHFKDRVMLETPNVGSWLKGGVKVKVG